MYSLNTNNTDDQSEHITGPFINSIRHEAKIQNIAVSIGVHERTKDTLKLMNSHILIENSGDILAVYRKIHLFDVNILNGPSLQESSSTIQGSKACFNQASILPPVDCSVGKIGLGICYDLRFPEQSLILRKKGMEIMTYPSAFTVTTGRAHWEILIRSRAIETQSFVVAAAQVGQHTEKRQSYGNSMIVDPWGTVLATCGDAYPVIASADIDLNVLEKIRAEMPVMGHRRNDLYTCEYLDDN